MTTVLVGILQPPSAEYIYITLLTLTRSPPFLLARFSFPPILVISFKSFISVLVEVGLLVSLVSRLAPTLSKPAVFTCVFFSYKTSLLLSVLVSLWTFECSQFFVSCASFACFSAYVQCSHFLRLWMAGCPDFYSTSPSQIDVVGESLWGSYYTSPSLEIADKEIEEYMNKTFPKLDDLQTSDFHQPLPYTSNTTDEADGKSSVTDDPPSSNYQPPPNMSTQANQASYQPFSRAFAAVNQKESNKDPGEFLNHLTEMEYNLLTAKHTPAVSPSEVTADVPPMKIKGFGAVPSSDELVVLPQF